MNGLLQFKSFELDQPVSQHCLIRVLRLHVPKSNVYHIPDMLAFTENYSFPSIVPSAYYLHVIQQKGSISKCFMSFQENFTYIKPIVKQRLAKLKIIIIMKIP